MLERLRQLLLRAREPEEPAPSLIGYLPRDRHVEFILKKVVEGEHIWRIRMRGDKKDKLVDVSSRRILLHEIRKFAFHKEISWDDRRFNINILCIGRLDPTLKGDRWVWSFQKL